MWRASPAMNIGRRIALIHNEASGGNDAAAVAELEDVFRQSGRSVIEKRRFPDDPAPGREELREAGVELLAVFAGDGTVSSVVTGLYGWEGAILVLPGGTMNMLARRLHGESDPVRIVRRLNEGRARKARPTIVRSSHGDGLSGVLAGPGAAWNDVREALRAGNIADTVSGVIAATTESAMGAKVVCVEPRVGRPEGYAAITLTPTARGLEGAGYFAETVGDYMRQGVALLQRDFRTGPHEDLGVSERWRVSSPQGEALGLLIDGESCAGAAEETFALARCEVDLLATAHAG